MLVIVNEENIDTYKIDEKTGNPKERLLEAAQKAEDDGYILRVHVEGPDIQEEEGPAPVNIFDKYEKTDSPSEPLSEGIMNDRCRIEMDPDNVNRRCIIHNRRFTLPTHTSSSEITNCRDIPELGVEVL